MTQPACSTMVAIDEEALDKLAEETGDQLEKRFTEWLLEWRKHDHRVDGDIIFQAGAQFQEAYALGYRAAEAARAIPDIHVLDGMARQWSEDSKAHAETMLRLATVERERDENAAAERIARERDQARAACERLAARVDSDVSLARLDRLEREIAQRDRSIAELEAALRQWCRELRESGKPSDVGHHIAAEVERRFLSAPAQPVTAAASCYCANECVCGKRYGATAPSPAAAKRVCRECHSDLHLYSHKPSCTSAVAGLTVTPEQYDAITKAIESPAAPTQALRDLFATKATAAHEATMAEQTITGMTCGCGRGMLFDEPDLWSCKCGVRVRITDRDNSSNRTADEQKAMERLERVARMRLNVGVNDVVDSMLVDAVEALDAARSNGAK